MKLQHRKHGEARPTSTLKRARPAGPDEANALTELRWHLIYHIAVYGAKQKQLTAQNKKISPLL